MFFYNMFLMYYINSGFVYLFIISVKLLWVRNFFYDYFVYFFKYFINVSFLGRRFLDCVISLKRVSIGGCKNIGYCCSDFIFGCVMFCYRIFVVFSIN